MHLWPPFGRDVSCAEEGDDPGEDGSSGEEELTEEGYGCDDDVDEGDEEFEERRSVHEVERDRSEEGHDQVRVVRLERPSMATKLDERVRRVEREVQTFEGGEDVEQEPAHESSGCSRAERDQRRLVRSQGSMARRLRSRHRPRRERERGRRREGRRERARERERAGGIEGLGRGCWTLGERRKEGSRKASFQNERQRRRRTQREFTFKPSLEQKFFLDVLATTNPSSSQSSSEFLLYTSRDASVRSRRSRFTRCASSTGERPPSSSLRSGRSFESETGFGSIGRG